VGLTIARRLNRRLIKRRIIAVPATTNAVGMSDGFSFFLPSSRSVRKSGVVL
jgi:hypothetical protein